MTLAGPAFGQRSRSERTVIGALLRLGTASQSRLVTETGLSRPTVRAVLDALAEAGLVSTEGGAPPAAASGRRPQVYQLTPAAGVAVGVEIGRRNLRVVVADGSHRRLATGHAPHQHTDDPYAVFGQVHQLVQEALAEAGPAPLLGLGVGIPLPVTRDGRVASRTIIPRWATVDIIGELGKLIGDGVPVHLSNDAGLGALGELRFGAGRGASDLVYLKLGTGIGAGLIIGGRYHRGAAGMAGEFGHTAVGPREDTCVCGGAGCLELYAGGQELLRKAAAMGAAVLTVDDLVDRAKAGDPGCHRIVKDAAEHIGRALGIVVNLLGPPLILLGGTLSEAGQLLYEPLVFELGKTGMRTAVEAATVEFATLGEFASAWGGVALVIEELIES